MPEAADSGLIPMSGQILASWRTGAVRRAIIEFVERMVADVPVEVRVAAFDNDGTLWCEKPMPIQLDFITRRPAEMVAAEPELREGQPWKAVAERDLAWFGALMSQHYAGDDTNVRLLAAGILAAHADISVEDFEQHADAFLRTAKHPTLGRGYLHCGYTPMVELLRYLEANGFANYTASGSGRDFMRPVTQDMYGIPRERVIGSSLTFRYTGNGNGGAVVRRAEADYLDDGPEKPVRIWNRVGRRPVLAAGNSNGDVPMLEFAYHADRPTLRLLILHDDGDREFDYTAGAEQALERARTDGWTVVSVRNDWAAVFSACPSPPPTNERMPDHVGAAKAVYSPVRHGYAGAVLRAWPRPIQRHRVGLELPWVMLVRHLFRTPELPGPSRSQFQ